VARPQRQGVGGNSAGGERASERGGRVSIPAPANDNQQKLLRRALRSLLLLAALGLFIALLRHTLG